MYVCMYANRATYDRVTRITEQIRSVVDFDSIMVTRLNGFRSVAEYYHHLTATDPQILTSPFNRSKTYYRSILAQGIYAHIHTYLQISIYILARTYVRIIYKYIALR